MVMSIALSKLPLLWACEQYSLKVALEHRQIACVGEFFGFPLTSPHGILAYKLFRCGVLYLEVWSSTYDYSLAPRARQAHFSNVFKGP